MKTLDQKMNELSAERRQRIEGRAAQLIAEELSLREIRNALQKTQKTVAHKLGMGQDGVSRLEKRSDLLLSTLRNYVEAVGGRLSLIAEFPDREPVKISGLKTILSREEEERKHRRAARAAV